jgi:hypothetical protein
MDLTLIEAAKYQTRLEHLAVIKTFAEGELLSRDERRIAAALQALAADRHPWGTIDVAKAIPWVEQA